MIKRVTLLFAAVLLAMGIAALADNPQARRHDFPPVGNYQVLCGDFHMHTVYSDGGLTPRERVEEAYRLGYDVISSSDHHNTRAYRVMNQVGSKLGMVVIRGLETGVAGNEHMNAINVSSDYVPVDPHQWSKKPNGETIYYRDAMKQIADAGGFLIYNHPHCGYNELLNWGIQQGFIIGIEVKNEVVGSSWSTTEWNGIYCYPDAFDFALKNNLAVFANTDAHGKRSNNPARTLVLADERSVKGVTDAIRARRTAAWFQDTLWGREPLLRELLASCVNLKKTESGKITIENKSPMLLKGSLAGSTPQDFDLPAYGSASVDSDAAGTVGVTWRNVWTDPRTNLKMDYKL
jgi:histidinol phosphatase-like PHP family hydrolase